MHPNLKEVMDQQNKLEKMNERKIEAQRCTQSLTGHTIARKFQDYIK